MALNNYSMKEIETMLHKGDITAKELVDLSLKQIEAVDEDVKAFLTVDEKNAEEKATQLDNSKSYDGKLAGIPGSIKDNIVTKGVRTTGASKMLANLDDPLYDATIVKKLNEADAISIGKVNLDEFAMGSSTETSAFQKTTNPWNTEYVPGGASGGSAASVAAGEVMFSIGT